MAIFRADKSGWPDSIASQLATAGTVGPLSRSRERTPTQNFLEVLTEASALQRIEMALKPQNDREMKVSKVQIPLAPPTSLRFEAFSGEVRKLLAV